MVFVNKSAFFFTGFLEERKPEKNFFSIFWIGKNAFLDLKSEVLEKSKKSSFWKGVSPWFCSKNRPFLHVFLSRESQKKNIFSYSGQKRRLFRLEIWSSKSVKNRHFLKGLVHGFVKKSTFFLYFFFSKGSQKETFFDILDRKECFLYLKSEVLKKSRKLEFGNEVSPWVF